MDPQLAETTIKTYLNEIRNRLDKAAGIGRAADACAGAGFHEKGLEVALGQRFLGSNHIRQPRRVCRTKCG